MSDLKAQLDAAMGDPPRSTVDVDAIVRRQHRLGRLRVAGAAGATAAVLAGTVAGAVALTGAVPAAVPAPSGGAEAASAPASRATRCPAGSASPGASANPSPGASVTPSPGASATGTAEPGNTGADASAAPAPASTPLPPGIERRLSAALETAVRAEIGSTRLHPFDDDGVTRPPLRFFGGPCDPDAGNRNQYLAVALFGRGLSAPIMSVYVQTDPLTGCSPSPDRDCAVSAGPGGEVIRSITERGAFQGQRQVRALVAITKLDGTTVQLLASHPGGPAVQPPLTTAQLIRIGLAPGLSLTG